MSDYQVFLYYQLDDDNRLAAIELATAARSGRLFVRNHQDEMIVTYQIGGLDLAGLIASEGLYVYVQAVDEYKRVVSAYVREVEDDREPVPF